MSSLSDVDTVILAGGRGTRLKDAVADRPKVLADVGGRPFLTRLLTQVSSAGVRSTVLCTGYMAEQVEEAMGTTYGPMRLCYSEENVPLDTGGALRASLSKLSSETVLIMNGDSYIDADLKAYTEWFHEKERKAAMILFRTPDASSYGTAGLENNGTISTFREKIPGEGQGWINAGVYLMKKSVIESMPAGIPYSLERDLFPSLAGKGLFGYCCEGRFLDIGTPEALARAQEFFSTMP